MMWRILGAARRRRRVARQDACSAPDPRKYRWNWFPKTGGTGFGPVRQKKFLANGFGRVSLTNVRD